MHVVNYNLAHVFKWMIYLKKGRNSKRIFTEKANANNRQERALVICGWFPDCEIFFHEWGGDNIVKDCCFVAGGGRKATRITLGIAISIWLLAILCAIPAAIGSHLMEIKEGTVEITVCYPFPREWLNNNYPKVNVMMRFLILYVIPLTIIAIFYMNMANHLIVSTRNVPGEMQGTQRQVVVHSCENQLNSI